MTRIFDTADLCEPLMGIDTNLAILSLIPASSHIILKVGLDFNQIKFSNELNEVIATESLSILLTAWVLINVKDVVFVFPDFAATIFAEDVKLHKL